MKESVNEEDFTFAPTQKVMQSKMTSQVFSNRPQPTEMRAQIVTRNPEQERTGQLVKVMSNQYKLKLSGVVQVFQYKLDILGMEMFDANLIQQVVRFKRAAMEKALGLNVVSGQ